MPQTLAQRRIERLAKGCSDPIGTGAKDQRRTFVSLCNGYEIRNRAGFLCERIVFNTGGESRMKPVCERVSPRRAIDLVSNQSNSISPLEFVFCCPAHGAALAWSKRS